MENYQDLENKDTKASLGDWITRYNPHRQCYEGVKRDNYFELFSGDKGNVIRANTHAFLEEIIIRTGGDKIKMEERYGK